MTTEVLVINSPEDLSAFFNRHTSDQPSEVIQYSLTGKLPDQIRIFGKAAKECAKAFGEASTARNRIKRAQRVMVIKGFLGAAGTVVASGATMGLAFIFGTGAACAVAAQGGAVLYEACNIARDKAGASKLFGCMYLLQEQKYRASDNDGILSLTRILS